MDLEAFVAAALALALQDGAAPPAPPTAPRAAPFACPLGMRPVWGEHAEHLQRLCTDFRQGQCWRWFPDLRAAEGRSTPIAVCMDELEWPNVKGTEPEVMVRYVEAEQACKAAGKRLCTEFEWETACEGPEALAFPYGNAHEPHACNNDKTYRTYSARALESKDRSVRDAEVRRLFQGEPAGARPRCTSAFGVRDLVGNAEEWVSTSRPEWPHPSSLKGGYWSKPWTGCRGTNDSHGPLFRFYETGFRCCADPRPAESP
jgi:formylglycine-generating enzyme required for sulfatase activity